MLGELIVYQHALSAAERISVQRYLHHKWHICGDIPTFSTTDIALWLDAQDPLDYCGASS